MFLRPPNMFFGLLQMEFGDSHFVLSFLQQSLGFLHTIDGELDFSSNDITPYASHGDLMCVGF
jgi:hypothetical protein